MKILYKTAQKLKFGSMFAGIEVKTNGTELFFSVRPRNNAARLYTSALQLTVTYCGVSRTMSWSAFRTELSASFPYVDSVKEITVSGAEITYKEVAYGTSHVFSWGGSFSDPDPTLEVVFPMGFKEDCPSEITWTVSDPLGREYRVLGVTVFGKLPSAGKWAYSVQSGYTDTSFSYLVGDDYDFNSIYCIHVEVMVGVYDSSDDDDEHYTGFAEAISPLYSIGENDAPYPPYFLSITKPRKGEPCTVEWNEVVDEDYPVTSYRLMYAVNGGTFNTELLNGSATSFTHTHDDSVTKFRYEVRSQSDVKTQYGSTTTTYSGYIASDWIDITESNVYIGYNGEVCCVSEMYLGKDGAVVEVSPNVTVG